MLYWMICKVWVKKSFSSTPYRKPKYGLTFLNPLIILKKSHSIKSVLDARHFKSNTVQSPESWPKEPLATQLARSKEQHKSATDLLYAWDDQNFNLSGFSSGDQLSAFQRGFLALKFFKRFFTQVFTFFKDLI